MSTQTRSPPAAGKSIGVMTRRRSRIRHSRCHFKPRLEALKAPERRDLLAVDLVSVTRDGLCSGSSDGEAQTSKNPAISDEGRFVVHQRNSTDLVPASGATTPLDTEDVVLYCVNLDRSADQFCSSFSVSEVVDRT